MTLLFVSLERRKGRWTIACTGVGSPCRTRPMKSTRHAFVITLHIRRALYHGYVRGVHPKAIYLKSVRLAVRQLLLTSKKADKRLASAATAWCGSVHSVKCNPLCAHNMKRLLLRAYQYLPLTTHVYLLLFSSIHFLISRAIFFVLLLLHHMLTYSGQRRGIHWA